MIPDCKNLKTMVTQNKYDCISRLIDRSSDLHCTIRKCRSVSLCAKTWINIYRQKKGVEIVPPQKISTIEAQNILVRNVIRVGGRLKRSELKYGEKYPIILPLKSNLTTIIIRHHHESVRHQGRKITHGAVRSAGFYINKESSAIKSYLKNCINCQKLHGNTLGQIMSDLPSDRLQCSPPFTHCGMDVFGPHIVTDGTATRRNTAVKKCWGLLFTCLVSRAVHVDLLPALDVTAFKNAFRRFTSLRGDCSTLRSDRGSNFVYAFNQDNSSVKQLQDHLQQQNISWHFNPAKASNFGRVFERKIKYLKRIVDACLLQILLIRESTKR